jgi:flagellar protein FlbD
VVADRRERSHGLTPLLIQPRMGIAMILVTRRNGSVFALNPDLIERVEANPDSVISLVGGTKYVVVENLSEIIAAVTAHRAEVLKIAGLPLVQHAHPTYLRPVTDREG